ncbi:MAG: hypothetical protein ATN36_06000 [Epulopiscium sp. Nele67-Bin005]|nr:MAG: hypothetical protein ATN36_06000 [Epulopiscium sp. Nele67-Bin005]
MQVKDITLSYDNQQNILENFNLTLQKGKVTIIVGANGCGKSTLLQVLLQRLKPTTGAMYIDGEQLHDQKAFAKKVSAVYQQNSTIDQMTVEDLVAFGRIPHHEFMNRDVTKDKEKIEWALTETKLLDIRHKDILSLSGGQRQRVFIALALCQDTEWILLDEPTTYLDMYYQIEVLELLKKINHEQNKSIVMVLHDINQASSYGDEIVMLKKGKICYKGSPSEVINQTSIKHIYDISSDIIDMPYGKIIVPLPEAQAGMIQTIVTEQEEVLMSQPFVETETLEEVKNTPKAPPLFMRIFYFTVGTISLGIGIIGIFLPVLPTVPLLLLTSLCYAKASKRLHDYFVQTNIYKNHLESFVENRAMTLKTKLSLVGFASFMLMFPLFHVDIVAVKVFILFLMAFKYYYFMFRIETIKEQPKLD